MKTIRGLIQRAQTWMEVGDLQAELRQLKYWRERGDSRVPRIMKRLAELGQPVHPSWLPAQSFADRHPQLAEDMRRLQENFEADGLTGQWKGKV